MTLYELTEEYQQLMEFAEDPSVDPETLADTLEGLQGEIEFKADNYGKVIRSLEGDAAALEVEIERLSYNLKSIRNNITSIKKNLEDSMIAMDQKKIKTNLFSFNIQKNAPSLDVLDESKVPAEFFVEQAPKLDRRAALAFVKENGNQEWGSLKQTESLRMR